MADSQHVTQSSSLLVFSYRSINAKLFRKLDELSMVFSHSLTHSQTHIHTHLHTYTNTHTHTHTRTHVETVQQRSIVPFTVNYLWSLQSTRVTSLQGLYHQGLEQSQKANYLYGEANSLHIGTAPRRFIFKEFSCISFNLTAS